VPGFRPYDPTVTKPDNLPDKKVVVTNKGAYTSIMTLTYFFKGEIVTQRGCILGGQAYAFCMKLSKLFFIYLFNIFKVFLS